MTPRRLLRDILAPLDRFDAAAARSIGARRPEPPVAFSPAVPR